MKTCDDLKKLRQEFEHLSLVYDNLLVAGKATRGARQAANAAYTRWQKVKEKFRPKGKRRK